MFAKVFLLLVALACMTATMAMKVRGIFPSIFFSFFRRRLTQDPFPPK